MASYNVKDILDQPEPQGRRKGGSPMATTGRGHWTRKRQRMINRADRDATRIRERDRDRLHAQYVLGEIVPVD